VVDPRTLRDERYLTMKRPAAHPGLFHENEATRMPKEIAHTPERTKLK
jgi:hypothetical protein